jgi:hypothetical protein
MRQEAKGRSRHASRTLRALAAVVLAAALILTFPPSPLAVEIASPNDAVEPDSDGLRSGGSASDRFEHERAELRGLGEVTHDLINGGSPMPLLAPKPSPVSVPDIHEDLAIRLAMARARWQWGEGVRLGSVTPVYGLDGELHAYDVDFTLDGGAFGDYASVAKGWQEDRSARRLDAREEGEVKDGTVAPPRKTGSEKYGSVTVTATYDAPPFRGTRAGVSNFYSAGWVAAEIAAQVLGTSAVALERVIINGSWERAYEFTSGISSIVVQGHEPWGWYDARELHDVSGRARAQIREHLERKALDSGQDFEELRAAARTANRDDAEKWLTDSVLPKSPQYIPGYNTDFTPYAWHGGCSPTSGSMVLNYYDERSAYGKMTYEYFSEHDPVTHELDCHVSNMVPRMIDWMDTGVDGGTDRADVYPGMEGYANSERGYAFSGGISLDANAANWRCGPGQDMIDDGYPFVWSTNFYPGATEPHSVAVVGYDMSPDPDEFACYNTWNTGGVIEWACCHGEALDWGDLDAPAPGGGSEYNVKLVSLDGDQTYYSCGADGYVTGGESTTIVWDNNGRPADHVELHYSLDRGVIWDPIGSTDDDGAYGWTPPCGIANDYVRIRVSQRSSGGSILSADGSYGDFSIHMPSIPDYPILLTPSDGATCVEVQATLDWTDPYSANGYDLQVGTACGSGDIQTSAVSEAHLSLNPNTTYYWRVRAFNGCVVMGDWSPCREFTTGPDSPPAPTLQSPADAATCVSMPVSLDWLSVGAAVGYRLQVGTSCGAGSIFDVAPSDTTLESLDPNTRYYWRVRAIRACDVGGPWSDCRYFDTAPANPSAPALQSPADAATCVSVPVELDWMNVGAAVSYRVQIGTSCGAGTLTDVVESSLTVPGLDPGARYYWRVRAFRDCEVGGPWSDCRYFDTVPVDLEAPGPVSPAPGAACQDTALVLDWVDVPGAVTYEIELGPACGTGVTYLMEPSSIPVSGLEWATTYNWRARGRACGVLGKWSDCYTFTTRPADLPDNSGGTWALHFAGPHDPGNTCASLNVAGCGDIVVDGPSAPGRYDIYVLAAGVGVVTQTRFGLVCAGSVTFQSWTPCDGPSEDMSAGWPGCDEGDLLSWSGPQCGPYRVIGILDVYADAGSSLSIDVDSRAGFAEWCDDESPTPVCVQTADAARFGRVGFGVPGYNACGLVSAEPLGAGVARNHLAPNVPNPSRRGVGTTIHYSLSRSGRTVIEIVNASGRLVRKIEQDAVMGDNRITWDCRDRGGRLVPNGVYFYQLRAAGFRSARKMLVVD